MAQAARLMPAAFSDCQQGLPCLKRSVGTGPRVSAAAVSQAGMSVPTGGGSVRGVASVAAEVRAHGCSAGCAAETGAPGRRVGQTAGG